MEQEKLLTVSEYCEWRGISKGSAAQERYLGKGPKFIKAGRSVRYRASDLTEWLDAQTRQQTGERVPA
jgi:predicted DNA-binding transcriptional regulator AlpA